MQNFQLNSDNHTSSVKTYITKAINNVKVSSKYSNKWFIIYYMNKLTVYTILWLSIYILNHNDRIFLIMSRCSQVIMNMQYTFYNLTENI